MAKSYLTAGELAQTFHTVPELEALCEMHDPDEWGLLTRGKCESTFGLPGEGWELRPSLTQMWEKLRTDFFPGAEKARDIFLYYEIDVKTGDLRPQFIHAPSFRLYKPGVRVSQPAPH